MRFIFNFLFWLVLIIGGGSFFLQTPTGSGIIGRFFHYAGVEKTERRVEQNRGHSDAVRAKASDLSAAVDDKVDALEDPWLHQSVLESTRMNKAAEEVFRDKQDRLRDKMDRLRDKQQDISVKQTDVAPISDKTDSIRQKLDASQERAQAQRERALEQKEQLDSKAGQ